MCEMLSGLLRNPSTLWHEFSSLIQCQKTDWQCARLVCTFSYWVKSALTLPATAIVRIRVRAHGSKGSVAGALLCIFSYRQRCGDVETCAVLLLEGGCLENRDGTHPRRIIRQKKCCGHSENDRNTRNWLRWMNK